MRSSVHWARQLVAAAETDPPLIPDAHVLRAFAQSYLEMVEANVTLIGAVVTYGEELAATYERRGAEITPATAVRILCGDLLAGMHIRDVEALAYAHPDGGHYLLLGPCVVKDDLTGEWVDGVMYRDMAGGPVCTTSQQRWDDRFEPPVVEVQS